MYTCSEVVKLISSDQYLAAGYLSRLGIRLHLLLCKNCSRYARQLRTLAAIFREIRPPVVPAELERARARILEHLSHTP